MPHKEENRWPQIAEAISAVRKDAALRADVGKLAGRFSQELAGIYGPAGCAVFLIDDSGTNFLAKKGLKFPDQLKQFSAGSPLMQYLSGRAGGILLTDRQEDPVSRELFPVADAESVLCCPVLSDDGIRGLICLSTSEKGAFSSDDLKLVDLVAGELTLLMTEASLRTKIGALEFRDRLTGCLNRKKFSEDIEVDIPCSERYGKPLSLLKIDLDIVRQGSGQPDRISSDEILRKIGETLSYSIRMCDKLYRYAEREFILTLPGIDKERAAFAATRMQKVLGQIRFGEETAGGGKVIFSIGIASFPADAVFRDGLIRALNAAIREAKEAGGDAAVLF
ncbi:MAG: GGDEF domain-containing protein [Nitrospirae bacterium]|nr:MAG: GGDEF domain-containing protein [Nitrospirota bacterium]